MLEIRGLCCRSGKVSAVLGLSLDVKEGELVSLIGANGAGKPTTLKTVSGLLSNIEERSRFWEMSSRAPPLGRSSIWASPHCLEGRGCFHAFNATRTWSGHNEKGLFA